MKHEAADEATQANTAAAEEAVQHEAADEAAHHEAEEEVQREKDVAEAGYLETDMEETNQLSLLTFARPKRRRAASCIADDMIIAIAKDRQRAT